MNSEEKEHQKTQRHENLVLHTNSNKIEIYIYTEPH